MPDIPSLIDLLKAGAHFGHRPAKRHPKMSPFIFGVKSGVHIINVEMTQTKLKEAMDYLENVAAQGGMILFVGAKKQAKDIIKKHAEACGMPYVTERWLGGTVTNFDTISKLLQKYNKMVDQKKSGELGKYTKREQLDITREIEKLGVAVGGIKDMKKLPDALYICGLKEEKTALLEATKKKIPVVAITDTNTNPDKVAYPIPANDDAVKAIELITGLISQAVEAGRQKYLAKKSIEDKKVEEAKLKEKANSSAARQEKATPKKSKPAEKKVPAK
ncbi:MAG: 30S ribosomal protein S2 [Candidatus Buchananbacteria bacterium CG10_big_fil_rev_8_21_14_0_10_42_9]|uniref:Small ribosomal subunit protein uS2 n=1 Tax=Candidatus Buchananbacteria bacterium CG10_big_fil_rev_8_21_14_0_10_42_9 TaxID=1974526 RepID=A0A2H0W2L4_9BACT|nr:MAG: 30S ribosomal protein S2 [Candidatus Buchananbacteria bacterium CG10_big_fil_rev_8_21_14_0_10_42_9]